MTDKLHTIAQGNIVKTLAWRHVADLIVYIGDKGVRIEARLVNGDKIEWTEAARSEAEVKGLRDRIHEAWENAL